MSFGIVTDTPFSSITFFNDTPDVAGDGFTLDNFSVAFAKSQSMPESSSVMALALVGLWITAKLWFH